MISLLLLGMAFAAHGEPIALTFEAETIDRMQAMEVAGASGERVARMDPAIPHWGWATVECGRELPPGQYRITCRVWGAADTQAPTLLYWQRDDAHLPPHGLQLPRLTDGAFHEHQVSFFANAPFRNLIIKHGAEAGVPGVAIDWLRLESITYEPPPRIPAYRRALAWPYPAGIDTARVKTELEVADACARIGDEAWGEHIWRIERWLELTAGLTDLDQQVRYLHQVVDTPVMQSRGKGTGGKGDVERVLGRVQVVKDCLNAVDVKAGETALAELEADLRQLAAQVEARAGGSIWPDLQADPFTWVNAPLLQGFATEGTGTNVPSDRAPGPFTSEPTPFNCAWIDGPSLRLASPATPFSVDRSWTGAVWRSGGWTMRVSVFSPAVRLQGLREVTIENVKAVEELGGGRRGGGEEGTTRGSFILRGDSWQLLVVIRALTRDGGKSGAIQCVLRDRVAQVSAPDGATLWLLPVRDAAEATAWRELLPRLPTGVVQVRRGDAVTQYFTGGEGKPVALIPPLLQWALTRPAGIGPPVRGGEMRPRWSGKPKMVSGTWGVPLRMGEFDLQLPVAYLDGVPTLSYRLPRFPQHPLAGRRGINVWAQHTTPEDVAILHQEGANYVRLVITEAPSPETDFEAWFAPLRPILEACRSQGLRVNLDPHFLGGQFNRKYVDFWRQLVAAGADYRDVLAAYDLMNEPPVGNAEENETWFRWAERAAVAIRESDPDTPILVDAGRWANPSGFSLLRPLEVRGVVYGAHVYYPHGFTHQAMLHRPHSSEAAPVKTYPGWVPIINWRDESWDEPVEWWDRWILRGQCLPVTRWWIAHGYPPLDNGEFGVIGYAQERLAASLGRWTRDVMGLNETWRASWTLYGYHGGFGWYDGAKPCVREFWQLNR